MRSHKWTDENGSEFEIKSSYPGSLKLFNPYTDNICSVMSSSESAMAEELLKLSGRLKRAKAKIRKLEKEIIIMEGDCA